MDEKKVVGIIPARYEASRFPGKVIAKINNKPMIQYVWEAASSANLLDDLIIACDDPRVKEASDAFGAKTVMTAEAHSSGTERITEVVNPLDVDMVVNIQADEPLIKPVMIDDLITCLESQEDAPMATLATPITDLSQLKDPNVVKVVLDRQEFALYFSRAPIPYPRKTGEADKFYKHIGIYAYTKDFLFELKNLPTSMLEEIEALEQLRVLEAGIKIKVFETQFDTIGVDTPEDIQKVEDLLR